MNDSADLAASLDVKCIEKYWHCVGHEVEFPSHLDFRRILIGEHDLFIHNHGGSLRAYVNKCPHRGAKLILKTVGSCSLVCPYHGWSFQPSGTSVPRFDTFVVDTDPREAVLDQWALVRIGGFIFIAYHPVMSLEAQLGEFACNMLLEIGDSLGAYHGEQVINFSCNWKLAVENALESYHIRSIHVKTLGSLNLEDGIDICWDWSSLWQSAGRNERITRLAKHIRKSIKQCSEINGYMSLYLFPFAMLSSTEGLSFALQTYFPLPCQLKNTTYVSTHLYSPALLNISMKNALMEFYDSTAKVNNMIFHEDADICSHMSLSSWSFDPLRWCSGLESKVQHFRLMCRKVLGIA